MLRPLSKIRVEALSEVGEATAKQFSTSLRFARITRKRMVTRYNIRVCELNY